MYRLTFKEVSEEAARLGLALNTQNGWHKIVQSFDGGGYRDVFNMDGRLATCWAYLCGRSDERDKS